MGEAAAWSCRIAVLSSAGESRALSSNVEMNGFSRLSHPRENYKENVGLSALATMRGPPLS